MSSLVFKTLGSGFEITFGQANLGMIDLEVDGFYHWFPPTSRPGTFMSAWILRDILGMLDKLNRLQECNAAAACLTPERAASLRKLFDVEGQKPYSMEELESTKFTRVGNSNMGQIKIYRRGH